MNDIEEFDNEQYLRQIAESTKKHLQRDVKKSDELIQSLDTVQLLAASAFLEVAIPEDYSEPEHPGRLFVLEHICALTLKASQPISADPINLEKFIEISQAIRNQPQSKTFINLSGRSQLGAEERLFLEIRDRILLYADTLRCHNYRCHEEEILRGIFQGSISQDITNKLGFTIEDCIQFYRKLKGFVGEAFRELHPTSSGSYHILTEILKNQKQFIEIPKETFAAVEHFVQKILPQIFFLSVEKIAKETSLSTAVVEAILNCFISTWSSTEEDFLEVKPLPSIQRKPFIRLPDGRWFIGQLDYLLSAVRPRIEERLKNEYRELWDRYQTRRGNFLEEKTGSVFKIAAPKCRDFRTLKYTPTGKPEDMTELDLLIIIDKTALVIECKSGTFGDAARRAAKMSLATNVNELIGKGSGQAQRAMEFIKDKKSVEFIIEGKPTTIDFSEVSELIPTVVTLESFDPITTQLSLLRRAGVLKTSENFIPWTLPLADLIIICEMVGGASQLLHYLGKRIPKSLIERIKFTEELDLFGMYLQNGLNLPEHLLENPLAILQLASETQQFDTYYMSERDIRFKPELPLPDKLKLIISEIENTGAPGYSLITKYLLGLDQDGQKLIADSVVKIVELAQKDGKSHDFSLGTAGKGGVTIFVEPNSHKIAVTAKDMYFWSQIKKYKTRSNFWIGIVLNANGNSVSLAATATFPDPWENSEEFEELLKKQSDVC